MVCPIPYLHIGLSFSLNHLGILNERFWVHTAGYLTIIRQAIVSFCSVRSKLKPWICSSILNDYSGFSRGAYQVRALSAMIEKVRCVLCNSYRV
jgi:Uncharacterized alpha/beta hydrolase domain (DUF2235)